MTKNILIAAFPGNFGLEREYAAVNVTIILAPIANATLDQILEERQVELALEWGERFFDLVRTDRATQELPGFVKGESEYYPIPQDQIDLNPNLEAEPVPFEPEVTE